KHMSKCLLIFDENEQVLPESKFLAKKISFKNINFCNVSNQSKQNKIISNIDLNDTSTGSSDLVKTDYISSNLADMLFE
ncbi:2142_t:CDS:2, partial [Cetraspora pellucida]